MHSSEESKLAALGKRFDFRSFSAQEPAILALLSVLAVVFFLGVTGLSRIYHTQQESLGNRWFTRGAADLKERRFPSAVNDFRTALLYSRDSYPYQLNLAQALMGEGRNDQAYAYLVNLWERQPENGLVNLELARIAAHQRKTDQALRYYHNAIYATWPDDEEVERRQARLELIEYQLQIGAKTQAQSELIALAANLGDDPSQHSHVGDLFIRAQDYEHALAQYRLSLNSEHRNPAALAGAGLAAFELAHYPVAQRYLQAAVAANPGDAESAARLKTTELVLRMDPYRRQISVAQRDRIIIAAFSAAGQRLDSCDIPNGAGATASRLPGLADQWTKMKPQITEWRLRRDPDLQERAMELVFNIERGASTACGPPEGTDMALLLIAQLHEGS